jgi:DNA repair protein RadC
MCSMSYYTKTLPQNLRPREKLLSQFAPVALTDVIAAIIGSGCAQVPLEELTQKVQERILQTAYGETPQFSDIAGIGSAYAARLVASLKLAELVQQKRLPIVLKNPEIIFKEVRGICYKQQEHVVILYLNTRLERITQEVVTIGTVAASLVHPREVFRAAIRANASAIVMAHNHPSGSAEPSDADREVTSRIAKAGEVLGITLVDHIVCSRDTYTSLKMEAPELFC